MTAEKEQEEATPDGSDQITCTKISQELKEGVIQKYPQVFTGLRRLEKLYHIEMESTVTPVVNLSRTIPAAFRARASESRVR